MSIVVTGASGFIGGAVARALAARGADVLSIGRTDPGIDGVSHLDWDLRETAPQALAARSAGIEALVHAAALVADWGEATAFHEVNVAGTRRLLDALPRARVVHLSSTEVYDPRADHEGLYEEGGPIGADGYLSDYARSKAAAEAVVQRVHPQAAILRPAPVYGPGDTHWFPAFARRIRRGVLRLPAAHGRLTSLTHIDNAVTAVLAALGRSHAAGPINVADPHPYELRQALNTYMARAGMAPVRIEEQPADLAMIRAWAAERRARTLRRGRRAPHTTRVAVARLSRGRSYDVTRLRTVLGVEPCQELAPR